jgi:hypothetical protein
MIQSHPFHEKMAASTAILHQGIVSNFHIMYTPPIETYKTRGI